MGLSFKDRMLELKKNTEAPVVATETPAAAPAKRVFGGAKAPSPIAKPEEIEAPEVAEEVAKPQYEVGNIILLANEANKIVPKDKTEGEQLVEGELPLNTVRIKQKIAEMETFDGISLRNEMDQLKKLIKASPDACMFLLPEELGLCVRALRRMTDNKVAMDMGATKAKIKKDAPVKLSAAELAAALDDL